MTEPAGSAIGNKYARALLLHEAVSRQDGQMLLRPMAAAAWHQHLNVVQFAARHGDLALLKIVIAVAVRLG